MSFLLSGGYQSNKTSGTSSSTSTNTGSSTNSGSTSKTLTPYQQQIQSPLFQYATTLFSNPQQAYAPIAAQARDQVSSSYSGLADSLRQQFMSGTSGGKSGKFGSSLLQGDLARRGALANSDLTSASNAAQLGFSGAQLGANLLGQDFGSTTAGSTSGTSTGTTSGSTTGSSSGWNIGAQGGFQYSPANGFGPR